MDKNTKLKVTLITIIGIVAAYIYIYRGQLVNDLKITQRDREWTTVEPQGQLVGGRKNGEWKTYFENGRLAKIENYLNDTLHGQNITYRPSGQYYIRCNYHKGALVDSFFIYHPNGNLNSAEFIDKNGKHQGVFKIYHDNGQLRQLGQMVDGHLDGEIKMFYQSGKLKEVNYYRQRQKTGKWIWLSENGDTTKIESY